MSEIKTIKKELKAAITLTQQKATVFFKTGKGEYAEYDIFIGVTVPNLRKIAKNYVTLSLKNLKLLLASKISVTQMDLTLLIQM